MTDTDASPSVEHTVTITVGQSGDTLNFSPQNGITGAFAAGVLTLTGGGTGASAVANYQSALRSITFSSTSGSTSPRTITFSVTDSAVSNVVSATKHIDVSPPTEITGVYVSGGTNWASQFYTYLANNGLGSVTLGYA